jgi:hypothetical protein
VRWKTIPFRVRIVRIADVYKLKLQTRQADLPMSDQFSLTKAQLKRIDPFFPRARGIPRLDDRRLVSGTIYVI